MAALKAMATGARYRAVIVTEVTRMKHGMVCVAALDLATGRMVRPLQPDGRNWEEAKWVPRFMAVGTILDLTPAAAQRSSAFPHATEDHRVASVSRLGVADAADLFAACAETADPSVDAIFGTLEEGKYLVAGTHARSLGCVMVDADAIRLSDRFDKMQVSWRDGEGVWHNLPVTELAATSAGDASAGIARIRQRLDTVYGDVALRLGLARAWTKFDPPRCYLQLNGIILPG